MFLIVYKLQISLISSYLHNVENYMKFSEWSELKDWFSSAFLQK